MERPVVAEDQTCPIGLSLDVLGQKWTMLIVREAFRGLERFTDLQEALGCPRNVLASRLALLVDAGVLQVFPYETPGARSRLAYRLTAKGQELAPVLIALFDWGARHLSTGEMVLTDPSRCACGAEVHARLQCENGHGVGNSELRNPVSPFAMAH